MGISGQTIWRQTGNFLRKQKIIRKITYYEPGLSKTKCEPLQLSDFIISARTKIYVKPSYDKLSEVRFFCNN